MPLSDNQSRVRIRELNDNFRKTLDPTLGRLVLTAGVDTLPSDVRAMAIRKVATFEAFGGDNDPHEEHDFGAFDADGQRVLFKIDYFDESLSYHSTDPADPSVTKRVITIMLAEEY